MPTDLEQARRVQGEVSANWSKMKDFEYEGDTAYDNGFFQRAVISYSKALEFFPPLHVLHAAYPVKPNTVWATYLAIVFNRGLANCDNHDYRSAIDDFNLIISEIATHSDAIYHRGLCYSRLRDYHAAIENFTHALELNNDDAYAYNERGIAYMELGRKDEAIADFKKALEVDPKHKPAKNNLVDATI